jgi:hypothetical protein
MIQKKSSDSSTLDVTNKIMHIYSIIGDLIKDKDVVKQIEEVSKRNLLLAVKGNLIMSINGVQIPCPENVGRL